MASSKPPHSTQTFLFWTLCVPHGPAQDSRGWCSQHFSFPLGLKSLTFPTWLFSAVLCVELLAQASLAASRKTPGYDLQPRLTLRSQTAQLGQADLSSRVGKASWRLAGRAEALLSPGKGMRTWSTPYHGKAFRGRVEGLGRGLVGYDRIMQGNVFLCCDWHSTHLENIRTTKTMKYHDLKFKNLPMSQANLSPCYLSTANGL
jgi:hypothetical protein